MACSKALGTAASDREPPVLGRHHLGDWRRARGVRGYGWPLCCGEGQANTVRGAGHFLRETRVRAELGDNHGAGRQRFLYDLPPDGCTIAQSHRGDTRGAHSLLLAVLRDHLHPLPELGFRRPVPNWPSSPPTAITSPRAEKPWSSPPPWPPCSTASTTCRPAVLGRLAGGSADWPAGIGFLEQIVTTSPGGGDGSSGAGSGRHAAYFPEGWQ